MCFGPQILFCMFLPLNRTASKHVLPFCVYVIQQNGTQIIQAAIFSYFDFCHIMKPIFFKKGVLFCVFAIEKNGWKFFFVFLAFIGILIRFSDNKMEPIFASNNVFLFYVFVIYYNGISFFNQKFFFFVSFILKNAAKILKQICSSFLWFCHSGECCKVFQAGVFFLFWFVRFFLNCT